MKLTEYIEHTKNGIQCEFARNQTLRTEVGARRNFAFINTVLRIFVINIRTSKRIHL